MNVLGVDLGTKTGWAASQDGKMTCGRWTLATPKEITAQRRIDDDRNRDIRIPRLYEHLDLAIRENHIHMVVFEDVKFIKTTMQGQLWASLRSCVWLQTTPEGIRGIEFKAVPVQTLKKFATGWHNASKEQMMKAAIKIWPEVGTQKTFDDNVADALHLMNYGLKRIS